MKIKKNFVSKTNEKVMVIAGVAVVFFLFFSRLSGWLFVRYGDEPYGWGFYVFLALAASPYILLALYYALTFFSAKKDQGEKLYYFACTGIFTILYFAIVYQWLGLRSDGEPFFPNLTEAIYFSVVTWTTLGYGDFLPSETARYWVIVEALLGYTYMGLFVGKLILMGQSKAIQKN